jgi:hypothetical protein
MDEKTTTTTTREEMVSLEITDDPGTLRELLEAMIQALRGPTGRGASREASLAITKLQEARFWLGEHMMRS